MVRIPAHEGTGRGGPKECRSACWTAERGAETGKIGCGEHVRADVRGDLVPAKAAPERLTKRKRESRIGETGEIR